jgi:hypothetical protein
MGYLQVNYNIGIGGGLEGIHTLDLKCLTLNLIECGLNQSSILAETEGIRLIPE